MEFLEADIKVVLDLVARNVGINLEVAGAVEGVIGYMRVEAVPWRDLLVALSRALPFTLRSERAPILRCSTEEEEGRLGGDPVSPEALAALGLGRSKASGKDRMSIHVREGRASEVVGQIAREAGLAVGIDADLAEKSLTLERNDLPWRDVLETVAGKIGGVVWDDGKGQVSIRRVPRITLELHYTDPAVMLELIARTAGIRLEVAREIRSRVTVNYRDVPCRDALVSLSRSGLFNLRVAPDGTFLAEGF
jgi:hypothetical protein